MKTSERAAGKAEKRVKRVPIRPAEQRVCAWEECGKSFWAVSHRARFCCDKHRALAYYHGHKVLKGNRS
jgi:hypothetical protein